MTQDASLHHPQQRIVNIEYLAQLSYRQLQRFEVDGTATQTKNKDFHQLYMQSLCLLLRRKLPLLEPCECPGGTKPVVCSPGAIATCSHSPCVCCSRPLTAHSSQCGCMLCSACKVTSDPRPSESCEGRSCGEAADKLWLDFPVSLYWCYWVLVGVKCGVKGPVRSATHSLTHNTKMSLAAQGTPRPSLRRSAVVRSSVSRYASSSMFCGDAAQLKTPRFEQSNTERNTAVFLISRWIPPSLCGDWRLSMFSLCGRHEP
ncbi:hypothetical protein RRG08_029322 [Elysia crispata]|uniref:Uncharacterized protein n=1 Tax=Elysia crispata TaxID=231223 RepID=A0AAE1ARQ4_9GAST|nr:hypothetical protein RRG08_029322 [Elysia crispata]